MSGKETTEPEWHTETQIRRNRRHMDWVLSMNTKLLEEKLESEEALSKIRKSHCWYSTDEIERMLNEYEVFDNV